MSNGFLEGRPLVTRTEIDPKESPYAMKWAKTYDIADLEQSSYAVQALAIEPEGEKALALIIDNATPGIGSSSLIILQIYTENGELALEHGTLVKHSQFDDRQ